MPDNGGNRLDLAFTRSEEAATSLRLTAQRIHAIEETVTRIAGSAAQQATAGEQARGHWEDGGKRLDPALGGAEELARSQAGTSADLKEVHQGLDGIAATLQELTASIEGVRKDTEHLASSAESTAGTSEEV